MPTETEILQRLIQLEQKVDFLLKHLGLEEQASQIKPDLSEVEDMIRKGDTLRAIKLYVAKTGASLNIANEAVKKMQKDIT